MRKIFLMSVLMLSLTACNEELIGDRLPDGKYPLNLTVAISSPQSRAGGKEYWDGGEQIAVNIGDYTDMYTIHPNGSTTPSGPPYYWQTADKATVRAWYPYAEEERTYDIGDQRDGYSDFDFLYAETEGSYSAPVRLDFVHQMAKLSYKLVKGPDITDEEFATAKVTLLGDKSVTVSGGKIASTPASQTDEILPFYDTADEIGSALMVPQNMTGTPFIKVSMCGKEFIYTPDSESAGNLQSGYHYSYTITVKATGIEVSTVGGCEWTEGDSENVGITIIYDGTETEAKIGDYYYADGTWSDGGLRKVYADGSMEWAETTPQPQSGKTCIGIVFYTGRHENDQSDYSKPLTENGPTIPDGKVHGYVVALTDANNDSEDLHRWENGVNNTFNQSVGASTSEYDWQGYYNCMKIHEFVNNNAGWEMKHFPGALAGETYGIRTLDMNGNETDAYNWQQPLAAPKNTSGWFLPSCGQLTSLYRDSSFLSARMDVVKNSVPDDCRYMDKIKWFSRSEDYWSSTEDSFFTASAWLVQFKNGNAYIEAKYFANAVRAVLAF